MSESPNTSYMPNPEVSRALATTVLCLQSAVLLGALLSFWGWVADRQRLTDWDNNGISIQPNATIAAMFAALALILLSRGYRRTTTTIGVFVAFIGASVLFEYSSGINLGIDSLLMFGRTWGRVGVLVPGRMGPMGAMSWTILGVSLVLAARPNGSRSRRLAPLLCLLTVGLSGLSLIGYLYGASSLYAVPTVTVIAMQTATFIFAASAALIMSIPESGPMRLFSEPSPAGILARRVLPMLIGVPVLLGFLRLAGERAGLYDTAFGSALRTLSEITLFLFVLWRTTLAIDRQSLQRQMADEALQVTQQQFKKEREEAFQREHAARSEAERAVRLKDEFFATVSHELRTPLNAILGWSQFLKKDVGDPEKARHAAEVIERNGKLQAKLIADLLDMSRLVSGKMRVEFEGVDLSVIIEAAMESISPTAAAKGVRIDRVGKRMPQQIAGDPGRIQQVVWNLLSNAVKFTPRGGRVEIEVTPFEDHVEIRVSDTGEGITPKVLPHIFDRFRQGDSSITRSHGGLGIGLALVKEIVELHGGRVRAASDGEGKGATFVIELPAVHLQDSIPGAVFDSSPERALDSECLRRMRVLVVDDEPDALAMLRRILEEHGAFVGSALSAEAALAMLGDDAFDCIISDIGMPFYDGYAFIAEVRRRGIQVPAIALTAFTRKEDQVQTRKAGYQAHVCKPMEAAQLLSAITSLASRVTR